MNVEHFKGTENQGSQLNLFEIGDSEMRSKSIANVFANEHAPNSMEAKYLVQVPDYHNFNVE